MKAEKQSKKATEPAPKPEPVIDPNGWSEEQQKMLEDGMRTNPGSMPVKERWIKIAESVDGKSAKECYERFKEIVAALKKKEGQ